MKLTRRKLAASLAASAAAAVAQTQPPAAAADELKAARDRIKASGEALAKLELPMSAEPAFQFKA